VRYRQNDVPLLVRGIPGWRKEYSIEVEGHPRFFGCQQMSKVNGIKGAAEDSESQILTPYKAGG
jgi:hypothetical protein